MKVDGVLQSHDYAMPNAAGWNTRAPDGFRDCVLLLTVLYLAVYSLLDSRSVYSDESGSAQLGLVPTIFSGLALFLGSLVIATAIAEPKVRLGPLQAAVFVFGSSFWLSRLVHDGLGSSLSALLVAILLFAFSLQQPELSYRPGLARLALRVLVLGSVVSALFFPDWAFVPAEHSGRDLLGAGTRLIGLAASPNYLAVAAGTLLFVEISSRPLRGQAGRAVSTLSTFVAVVAVLWTQSRSVMLAVGVAVLLIYASRKRSRATRYLVAASGAFVVLSVVVVVLRAFGVLVGQELLEATSGRIDIWASVISGWSEFALLGVPADHAIELQSGAGNAHNGVLEALITGGVPFLAATGGLLVIFGRVLWNNPKGGMFGGLLLVLITGQLVFGTSLRMNGLVWNLVPVLLLVGECGRLQFSQRLPSLDSTAGVRS